MAVLDRPIDRALDRSSGSAVGDMFWLKPVSSVIPIDREAVAFLCLVLVSGVMRFWDLGTRMLHHDESLHAVYSFYLYIGKGYQHDPMMHGPFLFELNALVYFLLGATDATARVAPALFGTLLVGLPYLLRDRLGRTGAIAVAALLAVSPTILYYSRFIRHDIYQIFFMMVIVVATFRYFVDHRPRWLFIAAAATSLAFSDKEDTYFLMAIVMTFLLGIWWTEIHATVAERWRYPASPVGYVGSVAGLIVNVTGKFIVDLYQVLILGKKVTSPARDVFILLGTLILPMFSAVPYFAVQHSSESTIDVIFGITFAVLFVIGAFIGVRWNRAIWIRSAVLFWAIFIVLYTTFFSNPNGMVTGVFGSLRYWIDQQGVARGGQPGYYYLVLLPLYEFLAVGIAIGGAVYWLRHRSVFTTFLIYWCVMSMVLWGWASEKMPWMVIEMALPFCILAGVTLGKLIDSIDWRATFRAGGVVFALCLGLAILAAATLIGDGNPFGAGTEIANQQSVFQWVAIAAIFVGLVYGVSTYWQKLGSRGAWKVFGITAILLVVPFTIRAAWQVSYYHGDVPVEMLVYTQTSPDVGMVMKQIDDIAYRSGQGQSKLNVIYDSGVSWPFEWYLRNYTARTFIGTGDPPPNAPVILTGMDNGRDTQMKDLLGSKYVAQRYRLRWWFPEDTTYRGLTLSDVFKDLLNSSNRTKLWRYWMYRETPTDLGSTDFMLFVRRDLAYGPWAAPQAVSQSADEVNYQAKTRTVGSTAVLGGAGAGNGQFQEPKGVALGPDGNLYVADSQNNRIEVVSTSGAYVRQFGTKGTGDGQFTEPWGVAVSKDGNVYVADTWNHRVEQFKLDGTFVKAWPTQGAGQPQSGDGEFFGPRAITVDAQGNVYVTDTGNKRIQKFDSNGKFVQAIGGPGTGAGFFNEPVGIAVDGAGNFYVADTWNQRIQKFGPDFKPITSWPVAAWDSQTVVDKPYITVDPTGNVYVTDPQGSRIIEFTGTGQLVAVWGKAGTDQNSLRLPTGLVTDPAGNLFVTDSDNGRILKFAPVR